MGYPDSHSFTTSFRDPAGRLVSLPGRILRIVNSSGMGDLSAFLASETCQKFVAEGRVVKPGRTLCITQGEVYAIKGGARSLCALMQQTLIVMQGRSDNSLRRL